jgi:predicted dehydrogenase
MKVKIIGAGSAGNHICYALTRIKKIKKIFLTDINKKNLVRAKKKIFFTRYKKWNSKIKLELEKNTLSQKFDIIIISTPPQVHLENLNQNINQSDFFLIEKPLCEPNINTLNTIKNIVKKHSKKLFLCGYNHRLFPSTIFLKKKIKKEKIIYCEIYFKENTSGFLKAHSWIKNLNESYLSNTKMGGGALCEHSHALNLLFYFLNPKNVQILNSDIKKINSYDSSCKINFLFDNVPTEKIIKIKTKKGYYELQYNYNKSHDKIIQILSNKKKIYYFKKKRSDDFLFEANHIINKLSINKEHNSPINVQEGIKTMELILKIIQN